ncbi:MAG: UDP-N-acetylmuramoyl-tripeptide--D-alanyl-D-alanine ligase [Alkalimonas sp.]|nr:UDP-N-acetylmuramoyl-tripeptide--D-alanyl-D-alanine ligase [Alkalimonas sp.]
MVQPEGRYHYGYFPCFDRAIGTYNTLRHASSTYALLEAYEFNPSATVLTAIELALQAMTQNMLTFQTTDTGERRAYLCDEGQEIKLGGNALCLLALCKYTTLTSSESYLSFMQQLANGILSMQDQQSGRFVHVLHSDDFRVKEHFRIIYYDGEACFALLRYFELSQDEQWLNAAALAFDDFIARKHWTMHDHWLSYSVNELVKYRPDEKYFKFGLQNVMGHLDFVIERITTFPTLLELMMAAQQLIAQLIQHPDYYHLYHSLNLPKFYFAMHRRAQHMLNGFFWPELAMFYRTPDKIAGSFFIRHHAFRIRIDDLEHYLSGYIAYAHFLQQETQELAIPAPPIAIPTTHWSAAAVALATGGRWLEQPSAPLEITSVAISPHGLQDKALVMLAKKTTLAGFKQSQLEKYQSQIIAALSEQNSEINTALPLLLVPDNQQAVLDLGSFARSQMTGQVIAVTGSAGKSTMVAMLHHCLAAFGRTASNRANANLPLGVAWNLASMPLDADFIALELAIGSIRLSSRIARPNIAIVTTIAPAHLEYHKDVDTIARKKSRIFHEMAPGSLAVINRDIPQWSLIAAEAKNRALQIISFGRHPAADVRLLESSQAGIHVMTSDNKLNFQLGSPGQHQAMNALAAIAVASFLKLPLEHFCQHFASFQAIAGRGNLQQLRLPQGNIQMMDDAYNANPASMQALLHTLTELKRESRLLLVLGDMLELGKDSSKHHQALLPDLMACHPDKLFLIGPQMTALAPLIADTISVSCWQNLSSLQQALKAELYEQDLLVLKASHGIGLHKIVEHLQRIQL